MSQISDGDRPAWVQYCLLRFRRGGNDVPETNLWGETKGNDQGRKARGGVNVKQRLGQDRTKGAGNFGGKKDMKYYLHPPKKVLTYCSEGGKGKELHGERSTEREGLWKEIKKNGNFVDSSEFGGC